MDEKLVRIALNGFTEPWDTFVKGVVAREKLLDWQRLWDDFVYVIVTSECIHLYFLCIVPRCLFREVFVM